MRIKIVALKSDFEIPFLQMQQQIGKSLSHSIT